MTLVQASISNKGKCVILVADRLWTRSMGSDFTEYGFESSTPKIRRFKNFGVGFSGNAVYADSAFAMITDDMGIEGVVSLLKSFIITERETCSRWNSGGYWPGNIVISKTITGGTYRKISK